MCLYMYVTYIMLSKVNQKESDIYKMISLICEIKQSIVMG